MDERGRIVSAAGVAPSPGGAGACAGRERALPTRPKHERRAGSTSVMLSLRIRQGCPRGRVGRCRIPREQQLVLRPFRAACGCAAEMRPPPAPRRTSSASRSSTRCLIAQTRSISTTSKQLSPSGATGVLEDAGRLRRETRQPERGRHAEVWIPVTAEAGSDDSCFWRATSHDRQSDRQVSSSASPSTIGVAASNRA